MNKIMILLFIGLLPFSCRYDSVFDEQGFSGEGSAIKNGVYWGTKLLVVPKNNFCNPDTCIAIHLRSYNENGTPTSYLNIDFVEPKVGKRTLNYTASIFERIDHKVDYGVFSSEGHVAIGGYHVFEQTSRNYVEITQINLETGYIKGVFQMDVVRDSFWTPSGSIPDTIRFTNGKFEGRIYW
jgi:hypothetical protein